jgi:hypothetical protein
MKNIICPRCSGHGKIEKYNHVEAGICFECNGSSKKEVEDNVVDTILEMRIERKSAKETEKEFNELYSNLKNSIRMDRTWDITLSNTQGTPELTKCEHKLQVLKTYMEFKEQWKKYINEHMELIDDMDEYIKVKNDFESKYIDSLEE